MTIDFWEKQAKKYKYSSSAVNFDPIADDLENHLLNSLIKDGDVVCDLGCGNGRNIISLARKKKRSKFYGVDFSQTMIEVANKESKKFGLSNVRFFNMDSTDKTMSGIFNMKFDKVITKRLLINVKGKAKIKVMNNIHSILRKKGVYIMIECFVEPLKKINNIRRILGLTEIKINFFNEYLTSDFLKKTKRLFSVKKKIDFQGLYYFISRIYNAYLSKGKPDYHSPMNKLSAAIIKEGINPIEGYSPEIIFLLEKR